MTPTETVDLITRFISNLGFPVFVSVWLLIRTDRLLRSLTSSINHLADVLDQPHDGLEAAKVTVKEE